MGRKSNANPAASANVFSKLVSQSWLNSLFKKGSKQPLDDADICDVLPRDSTEYLASRLQRYWGHEVKSSKKPTLLVPFIKLAGMKYFLCIIYLVLEFAMRAIQPIYLGRMVGIFQDEVPNKKDAFIVGVIIIACVFVELLARHPFQLEVLRTGMNFRVAASALVYRKALRMSQASLALTNTGQIVNMVTNDVQKLEDVALYSLYLFVMPFLLALICYIIWNEIGYSLIPGMLFLFLLTPFQSWLGKFFAALRYKIAVLRDERIKIMNEVICGMKVIKMYAWERPFAKLVSTVRKKEIEQILKTSRLYSLNEAFFMGTIPLVTMAVFLPYVLTGNTLTSEKVFTIMGILVTINLITTVFVPKGIASLKESGVLLGRIGRFLQLDEGATLSENKVEKERPCVMVDSVYSSWSKESSDVVLSDISFDVEPGELLMVAGPVGCGKSSLLMALLRELPVTSGNIRLCGTVAYVSQQPWIFSGTLKENILFGKEYDESKYNEVIRVCALEKDIKLLMNGDETMVGERGVALSGGQKARVNLARAVYLDASIYLMDDPLSAVDAHVSRHIFDKCIRGVLKSKACILVSHQLRFLNDADRILCLKQGQVVGCGDLEALKNEGIDVLSMLQVEEKNHDSKFFSTENVSHEGQTISKRMLERNLSHSPTSRRRRDKSKNDHDTWSLDEVHPENAPLLEVGGKPLSVQFQAKSAHDLGRHTASIPDVKSLSSTSYHIRLTSTSSLSDFDCIDGNEILSQEDEEELAERRATGSVTGKVYKDYFLAGAGPVVLFLGSLVFLLGQTSLMVCEWWLAKWSDWEESTLARNNSQKIVDEKRTENISIYVGFVVVVFLFALVGATICYQILVNASRRLHDRMFKTLLRAPIYFFDTNPVGRILNRFSKDIGLMDDMLPMCFFDAIQLSVFAAAIIVMSIVSQPYVVILIAPIVCVFLWLRQYFIKSSREIKRLEALSRSPLYSHISATLQGLATIRASEEQRQFRHFYDSFQDHNSSACFYYLAASRWLGFRLDFLCAVLMAAVTFAPVIVLEAGFSVNPVLVGISLLYTKRLVGMFQFCVTRTAEVDNQMISTERVLEYTHIKPEAELEVTDKKPPESWPQYGEITGEDLVFRYHPSLPYVLKGITFHIKAKEKIGIVGRTGAGKSSLISALFRMAEPVGVLKIDGVSIIDIGLHDLRQKLSIIPQDPVIFAGSLRRNLDPFVDHTDVKIWDALEQVQLKDMVDSYPEKLDFQLTESGSNLSVGQRQLMCLARAILKHNKILIIDEATANVDHRTDHLIQKTIREKFKDCTVLTIAHRLNTIMDADRIMVLNAGRLVEFAEPHALLMRSNSTFSKMVRETGKETSVQLRNMARIAHEKRSCLER